MITYATVRTKLPTELPPLSRIEAERAVKRLYKKFGPPRWPNNGRWIGPSLEARRVWISSVPTRTHRLGWGRLIHDVSHRVFRGVYGNTRRPHDPLHAYYEADIAAYVAESGWLDGGLKPKVKPKVKPTLADKHAVEHARNVAAIKRWETKAKRASTALKKLRRRQARLKRA